MGREDRPTWKSNYFIKLLALFDEYSKAFIVGADNVGSKQMQQIRVALRGKGVILMGKNTTIRKCIRGQLEKNPGLEKLLPYVKGNVGFVFTNDDLPTIRDIIQSNKVEAPAKAGAIAPIDVVVQAQNTGLGPEKTSFFQALSIATKIARGTIEILSDVHLIKKNEKVGASEATLLQMLKIYPFSYGLKVLNVFDSGTVFLPSVLDITNDDIIQKFLQGVTNVASVSLQIGYPTVASVPHSVVNGFKNVLALAVATNITFKQAEQAKAYAANPDAFKVAVQAAAPSAAAPAKGKEAPTKKEEKKPEEPEPEHESDEDMGFGLFD